MTNYKSNDNRFDGRCFLEDIEIKLEKRLEEIRQSLSDGQKEIDNMQEYYWENYTEMDEYGYEDYDNQQALLHQVNANNEKLQLKHRFEKMLDAPFFGRVDFMYDGDDEPEPFYIGIGNFAEKNGMQPLIYDWRAPVCFMIMIKGRQAMRLLPEDSMEKSFQNGSLRSRMENLSMPLRVIQRSMMIY